MMVAATLAMALPLVPAPAVAQDAQNQIKNGTNIDSPHARRMAAQKAKQEAAEKDAEAPPARYPLATRQAPESKATRNGTMDLQKLAETFQSGDNDATIAAALEIAGNADANAYEKSFAYHVAGSAASNKGDDAAAGDYFAKAIENNGLGNDDHYAAMFNLAVMQYNLDQYAPALQTLDRFLAETKSDTPEAQNLRGGILMGLERYPEAAELYTRLAAEHPDDKRLRMNAVAAYQQADQPEKAVVLLAAAQAKGLLADPTEYRALYVSYINLDRDKDAIAVIEDGLAKGILKPGPDLAQDYMVLGQKAFYSSDLGTATEMYKRAVPMAADGEAALNLAKVLAEAGKKAEAKAAAQQALEKGVKDTAAAKRLAGGA
jgi:uncharacterized protein HemY